MKTMRPQRAVLPLAFLSAAFMLACQEQASSPVGPESLGILLDKKTGNPPMHNHDGDGGGDNPGSATYLYTFAPDPGVITTEPPAGGAQTPVGTNQPAEVVLQHCCQNVDPLEVLVMDSDFLVGFVGGDDDAFNCFGGLGDLAQFIGVLRPDKKVVNKVEAVFYFFAKDTNATPNVRYVLRLDGMVTTREEDLDGKSTGGIFPPEPMETTTVTFDQATIGAERKKEKNACSGAGALPGGTSVELEGVS